MSARPGYIDECFLKFPRSRIFFNDTNLPFGREHRHEKIVLIQLHQVSDYLAFRELGASNFNLHVFRFAFWLYHTAILPFEVEKDKLVNCWSFQLCCIITSWVSFPSYPATFQPT
jgi:hypothetical protein